MNTQEPCIFCKSNLPPLIYSNKALCFVHKSCLIKEDAKNNPEAEEIFQELKDMLFRQ